MNKKKISVRLDPYNYEMVKAVADIYCRDPEDAEGNFSEALNELLTTMRIYSDWSPHIRHWIFKHRYMGGDRTKEVVEGMKRYEAHLLKVLS